MTEDLKLFLEELVKNGFKCIDDAYLDKLLLEIAKELDNKTIQLDPITSWLEDCASRWDKIRDDSNLTAFIIRIVGILSKVEDRFKHLEQILPKVFDKDFAISSDSNFRCSFLVGLSQLVHHQAGTSWLWNNGYWKIAIDMAQRDSSLYVQRQASSFVVELMNSPSSTGNETAIQNYLKESILVTINNQDNSQCRFESQLLPKLKLLNTLIEKEIEGGAKTVHIFIEPPELHSALREAIEQATKQSMLYGLIRPYSNMMIVASKYSELIDVQRNLLRNKQLHAAIYLSQLAHRSLLLMKRIRPDVPTSIEMHFFAIQLIPLLVNMKKCQNEVLEHYATKLGESLSEETVRMIYFYRDAVDAESFDTRIQLAVKAAHGIVDNLKLMDHDKIVLTFQSFLWTLGKFVPLCPDGENQSDRDACREIAQSAGSLLTAILNAVNTILQVYKIPWNEAFEGFGVLTVCRLLLENIDLPHKTIVLTLKTTQLAIAQCLNPALALLFNKFDETSLEFLGPILTRKLHDPHWEVRDSALEVLAIIADLSLNKFPAFQDLLLSCNHCDLVVSILTGDAEGYVRASAIRSLNAMVPVCKLWGIALSKHQVPRLMVNLLKSETEGVVRREAVVLITTLLEHDRIPCDLLETTYETMLRLSIDDLHWEVRVNTLSFWQQVIKQRLQERGMVDDFFPPVTFSKQSKKIVTLTDSEIKSRLLQVLNELSAYGCLNALLNTLYDDCDTAVVQKASAVLTDLISLLRQYDVLPVDLSECKKRKANTETDIPSYSSMTADTDVGDSILRSDDVIEGIVQTSDLNLLVDVLHTDDSEPAAYRKEVVEKMSVDSFLRQLQGLDLEGFVEEKSKWMAACPVENLSTLLSQVLTIPANAENNMKDCY